MIIKRKSVQFLILTIGTFLAVISIIWDSRAIFQTANAQDPVEPNASGTPVFHLFLPIILNPVSSSTPSLSPEVETFITGTFLSHATSYPDPNEPVEVLKLYMDGVILLQQEQTDQALQIFNQTVNLYPESRHAHEGLATTLMHKYELGHAVEDLHIAIDEFILADRIGLKYGQTHYTYPVAQGLGQLREAKRLDTYFDQAFKEGNEPYLVSLHYAQGLSLLGDPRAEEWYLKAVEFEPEGVADAVAYYAEWLLDHGRPADVLPLITDDIEVEYTHFLKGVALEQLGQMQEAIKEYKRYQRINADFPAPARFKIVGSEAQVNSIFEGDIQIAATTSEAKSKLSKLIVCEANSESRGGKRAVGWTVRTRVFRAYSVPTSCGGYPTGVWRALASTASLPDKYIAIIQAPSQFSISCSTAPTASTNQVAADVYDGFVPDPTTNYCPLGSISGTNCNGTCSSGSTNGANPKGPAWFRKAVSGSSCPANGPAGSSCDSGSSASGSGKTCGNGGDENCFYRIK